jgi:hypothetical protein
MHLQVICLDNFFTGDKANIAHHIGKYNFELIRHDVVDPILLEVDQVYHLACPASPVHYKFNPVRFNSVPCPTAPLLSSVRTVPRPASIYQPDPSILACKGWNPR